MIDLRENMFIARSLKKAIQLRRSFTRAEILSTYFSLKLVLSILRKIAEQLKIWQIADFEIIPSKIKD